MFTDVPSGAISNTIDQSNHSERAFVEQHQEYPAVRRATSWKQQRSERIKQRRAVTEKARKSRNCLARRATKRVLDMRHTKERLAEESKAIEMPRDRAPSPYVLIGTEARATMGHEDRDEKGRAASPHVLIEPYRP